MNETVARPAQRRTRSRPGGGTSVLETVRKVLALESRQSYRDRAAQGGLAAFIAARVDEAPPGSQLHARLQRLQALLADYADLAADARPAAIRHAGALAAADPSAGQSHRAAGTQRRRPAPAEKPAAVRGRRQAAPRPSPAAAAKLPAVQARQQSAPRAAPATSASPAAPAATRRQSDRPAPRQRPPALQLDDPVQRLPRLGAKNAKLLEKLDIHTIEDLIFHFPRRHAEIKRIAELTMDDEVAVKATVRHVQIIRTPRQRFPITEALIQDETGALRANWFNQPHMKQVLSRPGAMLLIGKPQSSYGGGLEMASPEVEWGADEFRIGQLVPVYPKTAGITDRSLRRWIRIALDRIEAQLTDYLPESILTDKQLVRYDQAVPAYHFPSEPAAYAAAVRRLAFDELFLLQLGLLRRKREWQGAVPGIAIPIPADFTDRFTAQLPFILTAAQQRVLSQLLNDMAQPVPMSRLLQGDVGSGKTVVAGGALVAATAAGYQGALMAPTEVLAQQHHRTLETLLAPFDLRVELLIGSMKRTAKREVWAATAAGEVDVLVGTHALIQDEGRFHNLGLVIVDEQHRFGVRQRNTLRDKGYNPDMLAMTATPIPRTLALTVYGDLDVSVIDELPPGRQTIVTQWVDPANRFQAYKRVSDGVRDGRQAFVICPLIEESEKLVARAARAEFERLQRQFPAFRLGLLHGKLKPKEKEQVMRDFRDGQLDVLVSTTVVEVGIDVPNATIMVIEGAERFGLAQLHQLRGRVGRGAHRSCCLLFSDTTNPGQNPRLKAIEDIHDGFKLAEVDLKLRGPGEFFGTRQSGMPDLHVANLSDLKVLSLAREAADRIVREDPDLLLPEHQALRAKLESFWERGAAAA